MMARPVLHLPSCLKRGQAMTPSATFSPISFGALWISRSSSAAGPNIMSDPTIEVTTATVNRDRPVGDLDGDSDNEREHAS